MKDRWFGEEDVWVKREGEVGSEERKGQNGCRKKRIFL